jgi:hypothetical protein
VTTKAAYSAGGGVTREKGSDPGEDDHEKESRVPVQDKKTLRCYLQECQADPHHALGECPKFNAMPVLRRWGIVKDRKICEYCLGHTLSYPCWRAASRQGQPACELDRCGGHHHTVLHVSTEGTMTLLVSQKQIVGAAGWSKGGESPLTKNSK